VLSLGSAAKRFSGVRIAGGIIHGVNGTRDMSQWRHYVTGGLSKRSTPASKTRAASINPAGGSTLFSASRRYDAPVEEEL
jgi:hypothetical protein